MKSQGYDVRTNNRFNVWFISFSSEMKDHFMLLAVHFIFCVKYVQKKGQSHDTGTCFHGPYKYFRTKFFRSKSGLPM
jgi:hypothetical protein